MVWVSKDFAKKHYAAHVGKDFYKNLEEFITSAPLVAMVLEGVNAVEYVRKIVGSTEPYSAEVGTIRGDFAHITYEYANVKKVPIKNLVHASGSKEEAEREINLWFNVNELYEYKLSYEEHVL